MLKWFHSCRLLESEFGYRLNTEPFCDITGISRKFCATPLVCWFSTLIQFPCMHMSYTTSTVSLRDLAHMAGGYTSCTIRVNGADVRIQYAKTSVSLLPFCEAVTEKILTFLASDLRWRQVSYCKFKSSHKSDGCKSESSHKSITKIASQVTSHENRDSSRTRVQVNWLESPPLHPEEPFSQGPHQRWHESVVIQLNEQAYKRYWSSQHSLVVWYWARNQEVAGSIPERGMLVSSLGRNN